MHFEKPRIAALVVDVGGDVVMSQHQGCQLSWVAADVATLKICWAILCF